MRLGARVGQGCARLHDRLMRDLQVNLIELDEQWDFIAKKQRHVKQGDLNEAGDVWLFTLSAPVISKGAELEPNITKQYNQTPVLLPLVSTNQA